MNRKSIVSIIGPGHCGSTLLDLILGGHSRIFGAGELLSLGMDKDYFLLKKPINLINGLDDRFWSKDFLRKLYPCYKDYYNLWYKLTYYVLPENPYSKNRSKLYHLLLERSRKNILIDSSKGHFWIRKSIYQILRDKEFNHYLIYINRNPKGIINSYLRKYPERGIEVHINSLYKKLMFLNAFYLKYSGPKLKISYENLALNPETELTRVCKLLSISFESPMLEYWKHDQFQVAGNSGTKSLIEKYHKKNVGSHRIHKGYYKNHLFEIKGDYRWKDELTDLQQSLIDRNLSKQYQEFITL